MKLYRISTEDKPYLAELAGNYFESFYITKGEGYWMGQRENGATIDILAADSREAWDRVSMLARDIKTHGWTLGEPEQEVVYITVTDVVLTVI